MANVARQLEFYFSDMMSGVDSLLKSGKPAAQIEPRFAEDVARRYMPVLETQLKRYTNQMLENQLTVAQWQRLVMQELSNLYLTVSAATAGHAARLDMSDLRIVDDKLKEQKKYLDRFAIYLDKLPRDQFNKDYIINRLLLYPGSSAEVIERIRNNRYQRPPMPFHPKDGTTLCMTHCNCRWNWIDINPDAGDWDVYWIVDHAFENCETCLRRYEACRPLRVRAGKIVDLDKLDMKSLKAYQ